MKKCIGNIFVFVFLICFSLLFSCYNNQDVTYTLTINYYDDGRIPKQALVHVNKDARLTGLDPASWTKGKWKTNSSTGDFGYIDSDGIANYFSKTNGEYYQFKIAESDDIFKSDDFVTRDMVLFPYYSSQSSQSDISIAKLKITYTKSTCTQSSALADSYSINTYTEDVFVPYNTDTGLATLNIDNIFSRLAGVLPLNDENPLVFIADDKKISIDKEVGFGYTDYSDHAKRYVMDPMRLSLKDDDGNIYFNNDALDVSKYTSLSFAYDDKCGYNAVNEFFGTVNYNSNLTKLEAEVVFVPGTRDENGNAHPWPNFQHSNSDSAYSNFNSLGNDAPSTNMNIVDYPDYNHPIKDMVVFTTQVSRGLIKKIMSDSAFNTDFKFYSSTATSAFASGITIGDDIAWSYCTYYDCLVMANYLTYLYNNSHKELGFTPLSYVYKNPDGSVFKDCSTQDNNISIVIDNDANGFRLPTPHEFTYIEKLITDERCVPDFTSLNAREVISLFHSPSDSNNYLYYFQNTNEGKFSIVNDRLNANKYHYSGSGGALSSSMPLEVSIAGVSGEYITYYKSTPRTGAQAMGRNGATAARSIDNKLILKSSAGSSPSIDYNTRNGAGLYNITGYMWHWMQNRLSDSSNVILRSGSYNTGSLAGNPKDLRRGNVSRNPGTTRSIDFSVRFLRAL